MKQPPELLPQPREVTWHEGLLATDGVLNCRLSATALPELRVVLGEVAADAQRAGLEMTVEPVDWAREVPTLVGGNPPERSPRLPQSPEGYYLDICEYGLVLAGRTVHALYNGLQTLRQLLGQTGPGLPAVTVRDWPALGLRGVHLDLKGAMAPASYWREVIATLGHYKINAVLIEYEDKFPYATHPEIVGPGALSRDEIEELLETAADHFVEVIPLLQTIGHVEYILRRPEYAALRESGSLTQLCPQEPAAQGLVLELLDELLEAHPQARWVHLGADEAWLLGDCPRCRVVAERDGKLALYLEAIRPAIERVLEAGRKPIIWDDMIQRNLQGASLDLLPEGVVLCNWAYGPREMRSPLFYYGGPEGHARYRWASKEWLERDPGVLDPSVQWLEEAPQDVADFAEQYWDRGEYPLYGASLPWVRYFRDQGREVIGASAAKGANGFSMFAPMYDHRIDNVAVWARTAREDGATGVISTAWSRYNGLTVPCELFELGWHAYLASAAFYWEAEEPARDVFDRQLLSCFLSAEDDLVIRAVEWLDRGRRTGNANLLGQAARRFREADSPTRVGQRYLRHLSLAAELALAHVEADAVLSGAWAEYARARDGLLSVEHHRRWGEQARHALETLQAWRGRAREVLADTLLSDDVEEVIATQTHGYERRLRHLLDELEMVEPFEGDNT